MSQHNILRRLRKLEKVAKARAKAGAAHLGCIPFILDEDEFKSLIQDIQHWHLTDAKGTPPTTPVCVDELETGLRTGQYLIMSGVCRIQITEETQ